MNNSYGISDESRIQQVRVGSLFWLLHVLGGKHDEATTGRKLLICLSPDGEPLDLPLPISEGEGPELTAYCKPEEGGDQYNLSCGHLSCICCQLACRST